MAVEIRELVIKTEIKSVVTTPHTELPPAQLQQLKQQIVVQCLASLKSRVNQGSFNR